MLVHIGIYKLDMVSDILIMYNHDIFSFGVWWKDYVLGRLEEIPHIKVAKPEGAFYVLPDISYYYGMSASDGTLVLII